MNIDEARFVRRFECSVMEQSFAAEFDIGFLQPARRVSHAHNHAGAELIAVHTGISGVRVEGERTLLEAGDILLIPAGAYHANDMDAQQGERYCFRIYLPGGARRGGAQPLSDLLTHLTQPLRLHEPEMMPILARVRAEMKAASYAAQEMIRALLSQCFILLLRLAQTSTASQEARQPARKRLEEERMKKIDSFFSRRYMQQVTLGELAEDLYLSPTHTNRILRARYGRSFTEKLRDTRLQQARILLEQTDASVNRIVQEVGYISVAGFYSAFRSTFGMTPTEYRKRMRRK